MAKDKKDDVIVLDLKTILMPLTIGVSMLILSIVLLVGLLSISAQINDLNPEAATDNVAANNNNDNGDTVAVGDTDPTNATVSIDDDPVLGDKDSAKVAIVEFSDFECPFCKRHHEETHDQIVENFVNTGEAILVYRDFPLSFHDPLATTSAMAAECVQDQAGDAKFFEYAQKIYDTTESNGQGMEVSELYDLANDIGVDGNAVKSCVDDDKFADEIAKDIEDGSAAGITGTPGFIIGVLNDDGTVNGEIVSGAQAYSTFEDAINRQLANAK